MRADETDLENLKANYFIAEDKLNKVRKIKMREKMDCINTEDIVRLKELNKEEEVLQKELNTAYDAWQKVKDATRAEDMRKRLDKQKENSNKALY